MIVNYLLLFLFLKGVNCKNPKTLVKSNYSDFVFSVKFFFIFWYYRKTRQTIEKLIIYSKKLFFLKFKLIINKYFLLHSFQLSYIRP